MVTHVLVHGLPVCGFSRELPCNWPMGHNWVRAEEHSDVSCDRCREAVAPPEEPAPATQPSAEIAPPEPEYETEEPDWDYTDFMGYI